MPVSKTGALPLGDNRLLEEDGWESFRTGIKNRCLTAAIPIRTTLLVNGAGGMRLELAHLAAPEPKSGASTNFATPAKKMVATTGFEPVTPSL